MDRTRSVCIWATAALMLLTVSSLHLVAPTTARADEGATPGQGVERIYTIESNDAMPMSRFLQLLGSTLRIRLVWDETNKSVRDGNISANAFPIQGTFAQVLDEARALLLTRDLLMWRLAERDTHLWTVADIQGSRLGIRAVAEQVVVDADNVGTLAGQHGRYVATTIELAPGVDIRAMRNALQRHLTGQNLGSITEIPDANRFVVLDFAPVVAEIWRLVRMFNVATERATAARGETRAVRLEHAPASEAAAVLNSHFAQRPPLPGQPGRQPDPGLGSSSNEMPRITADPRTNQLLVTGTAGAIDEVLRIVRLLDIPVDGGGQGGGG